jgi:hypothetical protein
VTTSTSVKRFLLMADAFRTVNSADSVERLQAAGAISDGV